MGKSETASAIMAFSPAMLLLTAFNLDHGFVRRSAGPNRGFDS